MVTTSDFEATAKRLFAFLEPLGFQLQRAVVAGAESWVVFARPPVEVIVAWEQGAGAQVSLRHARSNSDVRVTYGLHELQQERRRTGRGDNQKSLDTLEEMAKYLQLNGDEVLKGDFTLLFERDERYRRAVGRNTRGAV